MALAVAKGEIRLPPKVSPPALHEGMVETSLQARLSAHRQIPLLWLCAGAGAGKTQGLRRWLGQFDLPFCWYQIDEHDDDLGRVLHYLHLCLRSLPIDDTELSPFNPHLHTDAGRHVEILLDAIEEQLQSPAYVVLDDFHLLEDPLSHPVFSRLITPSHQRLRFAVISRTLAPKGMDRWVLNRQVEIVGPESFELDLDEFTELLRSRGFANGQLKPEVVQELFKRTGGWIAAARLLNLELNTDALKPDTPLEEQSPFFDPRLYSVIDEELLSHLDKNTREVLYILSPLDSVATSMLEALDPRALEATRRLARENTLVLELEGQEQIDFRFHPLLRETIRRVFNPNTGATFRPWSAEKLHGFVADCIDRGRACDALKILAAQKQWSRFCEILCDHGMSLIEAGDTAVLRTLIDPLPEPFLGPNAEPLLQLIVGLIRHCSDPQTARRHFAWAMQGAEQRTGSEEIGALALSYGTESMIRFGQAGEELETQIKALEAKLTDPSCLELKPALQLRMLSAAVTAIMFRLPGHHLRDAWSNRILELSLEVDDLNLVSDALCNIASLYILWGFARRFEPFWLRFQNIAQDHPCPRVQLSQHYLECAIAVSGGRYERAVETFEEALQCAQEQGTWLWHRELHVLTANAAMNADHCEAATKVLEQIAKSHHISGNSNHFHRHVILAYFAYEKQDLNLALSWLNQARPEADRMNIMFFHNVLFCKSALLCVEMGDIEGARNYLSQANHTLDRQALPVGRWNAACTEAAIEYALGHVLRAQEILRWMLFEMRSEPYYALPIGWLRSYQNMLGVALEAEIEREFVEEIILRGQLYPDPRPSKSWPGAFELQVLGPFEVKIGQNVATKEFRAQGSRFELLTALIWLGGQQVADSELLEIVWPDRIGKSKNAFYQAIKRLRTSLGDSRAIQYDFGRVSLNRRLWKLDIWDIHERLENSTQKLQAALPSDTAVTQACYQDIALCEAQIQRGFECASELPDPLLANAQRIHDRIIGPPYLLEALHRAQQALSARIHRR